MQYDHLDDVPMQFRRSSPSSPAPSHYSIVTASTPSPVQRNLQQVMSPNPLESPHDTVATTATATMQAAAEMQQLGGCVTFQQLTRVSLPAETLQAFGTSIGEDLSFAADIQAAVTELSSRIQYRTEVLAEAVGNIGGSMGELQGGCQTLNTTLEQLRDIVVRQQATVQSLVEYRESDRRDVHTQIEQVKEDLRRYLEDRDERARNMKQQLDESLQKEANLLAMVEALTGQVAKLEESTKQTLMGLEHTIDGKDLRGNLAKIQDAVLPRVQAEIDKLDDRVSAIEEGPDKLEDVRAGEQASKGSTWQLQSPLKQAQGRGPGEPSYFDLTPSSELAPSFGDQDATSAWWYQNGDEPENWGSLGPHDATTWSWIQTTDIFGKANESRRTAGHQASGA